MKLLSLVAGIAFGCGAAVGSAMADPMPMDTPVSMNGIGTVCTGIGAGARDDPRWAAYPIRVEFSNGGAQYLSGAHVTIEGAGGKALTALDCSGAWVLFQLAPGNYKVTATLLHHPDQPARSASFSPPSSGQKRVVLQFSGVNPNE